MILSGRYFPAPLSDLWGREHLSDQPGRGQRCPDLKNPARLSGLWHLSYLSGHAHPRHLWGLLRLSILWGLWGHRAYLLHLLRRSGRSGHWTGLWGLLRLSDLSLLRSRSSLLYQSGLWGQQRCCSRRSALSVHLHLLILSDL